jgi:hypothetical protein
VRDITGPYECNLQNYTHAKTIINIKTSTQYSARGRTYDNDIYENRNQTQNETLKTPVYESQTTKRQRIQNENDLFEWTLDKEITLSKLEIEPFRIHKNLFHLLKNLSADDDILAEENMFQSKKIHFLEQAILDASDPVILRSMRNLLISKEVFATTIRGTNEENKKWVRTIFTPETLTETRYVENLWRQGLAAVANRLIFPSTSSMDGLQTELVDANILYLHFNNALYRGFRNSTNLQAGLIIFIVSDFVRQVMCTTTKIIPIVPPLPANEMLYEIQIFFGYAIRKCRDIAFHKKKVGFSRFTYLEIFNLMVALGEKQGNRYD